LAKHIIDLDLDDEKEKDVAADLVGLNLALPPDAQVADADALLARRMGELIMGMGSNRRAEFIGRVRAKLQTADEAKLAAVAAVVEEPREKPLDAEAEQARGFRVVAQAVEEPPAFLRRMVGM
jgi:hypothetical protein